MEARIKKIESTKDEDTILDNLENINELLEQERETKVFEYILLFCFLFCIKLTYNIIYKMCLSLVLIIIVLRTTITL